MEEKKIYTYEIPYTIVLFGKSFPVELELMFTFSVDDGKFDLRIKSLTGKPEGGVELDYQYLVDNGDEMSKFIIDCVVGNKGEWEEIT